MRVIASEVKHVRLLLVGGSNEVVLRSMNRPQYVKELEDLAQRIGIMDIVRFTGFCASDSEEASLYLRGADACVLPFDDGVMLHRSSVAAAAVHGVPIVTTKGAFSEPAFVDRHNVLLCRPNDPKELAATLRSLASDPKLQQQLRTGALQLAREWFSWERVVKHTVEVFQESVNGRVRPEHSKDQ
jgi:glycosyltransferase involved in cell wall biosynthesis